MNWDISFYFAFLPYFLHIWAIYPLSNYVMGKKIVTTFKINYLKCTKFFRIKL